MERAREDIAELEGSERGGVISGYSPIHSHVQLYLVQISFIVILCSILGQVVKKWGQPRVIAEVWYFVSTVTWWPGSRLGTAATDAYLAAWLYETTPIVVLSIW